jgi:hypothetical protein
METLTKKIEKKSKWKQKKVLTNLIKIIKIPLKEIISKLSKDLISKLAKILEDNEKQKKYDNLYSEIKITNDYSKFCFFESNRDIKIPHVKKLMALFSYKLLDVPVKVDEHFRLLDGQHTFLARMMLNKPIIYYISKNIKEEDVPMLNSNSKAWAWDDFLHSFIERGNKHYIKYKEIWDEYNGDKKNKKVGKYNKKVINHNELSLLVMGNVAFNARVKKTFYDGKLEFKKSEEEVREILDFMYDEILQILTYDLVSKRDFQTALFTMYFHKNFDKNTYLKTIRAKQNIYNKHDFIEKSQGSMKKELIKDYNKYSKKDKKIYLKK